MSRAPTTSSFPPDENFNERDDDSDFDVYSGEDVGTMKTMELRRAAKRRKEGGVNTTTTTTADDDDAIDFDRTLALGKRLEIYMILFLTHFLYYTGSSGWLFIYYVGVIKVLRREGYAEYVFMCRRIYLFLTTRRSLRRGFVSFFRFAKRRSFVLLRERR